MKSIRSSKFFTISTTECTSASGAANLIQITANDISKNLRHVMACHLIKVEIYSKDNTLYKENKTHSPLLWWATGLMIKEWPQ